MIFVFVWLTSLNVIISRSIHVATDSIISFFFFVFLGPQLQHMEVPRLRVKPEL